MPIIKLHWYILSQTNLGALIKAYALYFPGQLKCNVSLTLSCKYGVSHSPNN